MSQTFCSFWWKIHKNHLLGGERPRFVHVSPPTPMRKSTCTCAWVCVWVEAVCTPLVKVKIMTKSERWVSLGLTHKAPALLMYIPVGTGFRSLWGQFKKSHFEAAPAVCGKGWWKPTAVCYLLSLVPSGASVGPRILIAARSS